MAENYIITSLVIATLFSVIEYFWHALTYIDEHGDIKFNPFDKRCRSGFTTFAQWWANVLCLSIVLLYHDVMAYNFGIMIEIALSPIAIWFMEIVEGRILKMVYGHNPAWHYFGRSAYFGGDIRVSFWQYVIWVLLYAVFYPINCYLKHFSFLV